MAQAQTLKVTDMAFRGHPSAPLVYKALTI